MDTIRHWALGIVFVSIISTIVLLLSPSGSVEKQVKIAVSIVMLAVIVKPFVSGIQSENAVELEYETYTVNTSCYEEYIASSFKTEIANRMMILLKEKGFEVKEVQIDVNFIEDKISIEKVNIVIDDEYSGFKDEILEIVKKEYGIIAETEVVD